MKYSEEFTEQVLKLLQESYNFHEYCGWGDAWEVSCARASARSPSALKRPSKAPSKVGGSHEVSQV